MSVARRRGNPTWGRGRPNPLQPRLATAFEVQVRKLGLNEQTCAKSEKLKQWCKGNKDRCYIPEWLLKQWAMAVEPRFSAENGGESEIIRRATRHSDHDIEG
jgi:hypothetical protein